MTNHWVDIKNSDVVLVMGGNAAEAHPCGFKWVIEAKAHNNAKLIVVDPRFTRTAAVADLYIPIRSGTDIIFLGGVIKYMLDNNRIHKEYVKNYTDFTFIVREDFAFADGYFSGWNAEKNAYDKTSWDYEKGADGFVKTDPTMAHPRCVGNLMKKHYAAYTPELVERACGSPKDKFLEACKLISSCADPKRVMSVLYALGWCHHSVGSQNVRIGAMVQLLSGNIGEAGGGTQALRGHSNVQGLTDLGLLSNQLPGYLTLPNEPEQDYEGFITARTRKPLRKNQMSYWQNYSKFHVSLMKSWWGSAATAQNHFAYDYLPKHDKEYDVLQQMTLMGDGKMNGFICQGFNPLATAPDEAATTAALSKLKWLVIMDPLETETAEFWKKHDEFHDVDYTTIATEVFRLPTGCFAEEEGAIVNSGRWLQWHWQGAEPPGEARLDVEIMSELYLHLKHLYQKDGGAFPDPILNLSWPYIDPAEPTAEELAKEYNGRALVDIADAKDPTKIVRKAGEQVAGFGELKDDGSTACGCWIYAGCWPEAGNLMARRDNSDPANIGQTRNWAWSWPANRRILYNRASCDLNGKPFNRDRKLIEWNGKNWTGFDVPDFKADEDPANGMGPFIMNPEGVARFFARGGMNEGPFPVHYEPFESPVAYNPLFPDKPNAAVQNPAARVFKKNRDSLGKREDFPHVATTYRLTEHFHYWTEHSKLNSIVQPQQFVEIGEGLAKEVGVKAGDWVKVSSNRGSIKAVAVVTKRIKTLQIEGKPVHHVGLPIHWGFKAIRNPGYLVNSLSVAIGDSNSQTPEFKAFLVKVERA
jgi:formate dehydrogenase major subunit